MATSKALRRTGWVMIVLIGLALGVLLGRLVLPPGGPDPRIEPTPSAHSVVQPQVGGASVTIVR